jgi:hypothetical protein
LRPLLNQSRSCPQPDPTRGRFWRLQWVPDAISQRESSLCNSSALGFEFGASTDSLICSSVSITPIRRSASCQRGGAPRACPCRYCSISGMQGRTQASRRGRQSCADCTSSNGTVKGTADCGRSGAWHRRITRSEEFGLWEPAQHARNADIQTVRRVANNILTRVTKDAPAGRAILADIRRSVESALQGMGVSRTDRAEFAVPWPKWRPGRYITNGT